MNYNGDKLHELKKEQVTLLLRHHIQEEFDLKGLYVNDNPEDKFMFYIPYNHNNKDYIQISDYLFNKLKAKADKELEKFIEDNINNIDMYFEGGEYYFWKRFNMSKLNSDLNPDLQLEKYRKVLIGDEISQGILTYKINREKTKFDFVNDRFIALEDKPLNIIYGDYKYLLLAIEQYKRGKAPKLLEEVIKFNDWTAGNKSLWVKLKEGKRFKIKTDIKAGKVFTVKQGKLFLKERFGNPNLNRDIPLSDIEYFEYNRNKYKMELPDEQVA